MNRPLSLSARLDLAAIRRWNRRIEASKDAYACRSAAAEGMVPCGCGSSFRSERSVSVHRGRTGCKGRAK